MLLATSSDTGSLMNTTLFMVCSTQRHSNRLEQGLDARHNSSSFLSAPHAHTACPQLPLLQLQFLLCMCSDVCTSDKHHSMYDCRSQTTAAAMYLMLLTTSAVDREPYNDTYIRLPEVHPLILPLPLWSHQHLGSANRHHGDLAPPGATATSAFTTKKQTPISHVCAI